MLPTDNLFENKDYRNIILVYLFKLFYSKYLTSELEDSLNNMTITNKNISNGEIDFHKL